MKKRLPLISQLCAIGWAQLCVALIMLMAAAQARAQAFAYPQGSVSGNCAALAQMNFLDVPGAPAQVVFSRIVPASGNLPAYCEARGYTAQSIRFKLELPVTSSWNGDYFFEGCGGYCGTLAYIALGMEPRFGIRGIEEGYASVTSDTGHDGKITDGLWAFHDHQAEINYGYLGVHKVTVATKAIAGAYYGRAPRKSYFVGASHGGGQAMMEAERYPADYDGIVAQIPDLHTPDTAVLAWQWSIDHLYDPSGKPVLSTADVQHVHKAVLAACDALDGARDGIIDDPQKCHFDPSTLQCGKGSDVSWCLSPPQVDALRNVYAGAYASSGKPLYPGEEVGSELARSGTLLPATPGAIVHAAMLTHSAFRFIAFDPPFGLNYNPRSFNYDTDLAKIQKLYPAYDSSSPDLRQFESGGGKLVMTADWADPMVVPGTVLAYYKALSIAFGGPQNLKPFFRLFMIPGAYHGSLPREAHAPRLYDPLQVISNWVEHGVAPDSLIVSHLNSQGQVDMKRTLYPYPQKPAGYQMK